MKEYTIDAENKKLGRVASDAAKLLLGKNTTDFAKNVVVNVKVTITNASKADISTKKKDEKQYVTYSGYPGGIKHEAMGHLIGRKGYKEAFKTAVHGMLPKNKLRAKRIKNLIITE